MSDYYKMDKSEENFYDLFSKSTKYYVPVCRYLNGWVYRYHSDKGDRLLFYSWQNEEVYATGLFWKIRVIMANFDEECTSVIGVEILENGTEKRYFCDADCWTDFDVFYFKNELQLEKKSAAELKIFEYHYFTQKYLEEHCVGEEWVCFDCGPENVFIMESDGKLGLFHYVVTRNEGDFYYKLLEYQYDGIEVLSFLGQTTLSDEYIDRWFLKVNSDYKYGLFEMICKDEDTDVNAIELKELIPCVYDKIDFAGHTIKLFFNNKNMVRSVSWRNVEKIMSCNWYEVVEHYIQGIIS